MNVNMALFDNHFINIIFFLICIIAYCNGDEILGCGGFFKSDIDVNFSEVEVKLYTKQGNLKDHTDCAPNNGYYFLPFYDKGEYVLKIEPPSGWSFEPKEVVLNIDGVTDPCSQGKDINFVLLGFAVKGKVTSFGSDIGPKNVKVVLYSHTESGLKPSLETVTSDSGDFLFTPVLPGKYTVKIEHAKWHLAKDSAVVEVASGNTIIDGTKLVVAGYDVSGRVTSEDEPIRGVSFVLFAADKTSPPLAITGCSTTALAGMKAAGSLCHVTSDEHGLFLFSSLPPARYRVVPHYEGPQSLQFDVQPKQMEFIVKHDSLVIASPFQVTGFSVSGRVLSSIGGHGLEGASIYLDDKAVAQTRADGSYHLGNMKAGSYKIQVQAKDMKFDEIVAKISPNTPILGPISPASFKVCGKILPYHYHQGPVEIAPKFVLLIKDESLGSPIIVETKAGTGEFCQFLEPGKYEAKVEVTDLDKSRGLQFFPAGLVINIKDRPILMGIEFSQLKAKLSGQIICLVPNCPEITMNLHTILSDNEKLNIATIVATNGKYLFENILPGTYQLTIAKSDWCWETNVHTVLIANTQSTAPTFKQNGFAITLISSHETKVNYKLESTLPDTAPISGQFLVKKGTSQSCVKSQGSYEFTLLGCHGYAQQVFQWSTANSAVATTLEAISHTLGGSVTLADNVNDLYVTVKHSADNKIKSKLGPLVPKLVNGQYIYSFELLVLEGENIFFEPSASVLLFEPTIVNIIGANDCVENGVTFTAEKGKIIEGKMVPMYAGIAVTITNADGDVITVTETDKTGSFRVGPLPKDAVYKVSAEKEGYVISGPDSKGNFNVHKLAQIDVTVIDKSDSKPLQGVLLSLSGDASFRRNSQTNAEGKMTFPSLSPGEYYLRPMMKEFRFEPTSQMISVEEGATFTVRLAGNRVAFSAYGSVTSLNGEPEDGVVVEAVGKGGCQQQEETTSETNGQFRIRGLQPECEYDIRLKVDLNVNTHIQRGTPSRISIKVTGDVSGLKLVAFQRVAQMDVSALVSAPSHRHLRTLRVKLCREDAPDSPVHVMKLESSCKLPRSHQSTMLLFPNIPIDNRAYFIQLESSLPKTTHSFHDDVVHFKANATFKHVSLVFKPEQKVADQDLGQSSYLALVLLGILVIGYLRKDSIVSMFVKLIHTYNDALSSSSPVKKGNNDISEAETISVEPVINVAKRKVKPRKT